MIDHCEDGLKTAGIRGTEEGCFFCAGTGRIEGDKCQSCGGKGRVYGLTATLLDRDGKCHLCTKDCVVRKFKPKNSFVLKNLPREG